MFLDFFGLREEPFGVNHDPKFLYWTPSHRETLTSLYKELKSGGALCALIAPPGMGKTSLLIHLLERMQARARTAYVFRSGCTPSEFLRSILCDLGHDTPDEDVALLLEKLHSLVLEEASYGGRIIVAVDDAHDLDAAVLETMRQIREPLQLILAGDPSLEEKLVQLRPARVGWLDPLDTPEVVDYISHRLKVAGQSRTILFTRDALDLVATHSEGIPRRINLLCYNALTRGYAQQQKLIDSAILNQVISEISATVSDVAKWSLRSYYNLNDW